ncbi:MAG: CPBP family intramembrane metalloprotease [Ferruginibacter sp.]|nr:CPBP family intramembrane metalloprotease [Ferruginibacter sp.]
MQYKSVKGYSATSQLGTLITFVGIGLILTVLFQLILAWMIVPANIPMDKWATELQALFANPEYINYVRISQVINSFFLLAFPAIMFTRVVNGKSPFWLGFNSYVNGQQLMLGFLALIVANMFASSLADLSKLILSKFPHYDTIAASFETKYEEQIKSLVKINSLPQLGLALLIMAFIPALFEEILFRGTIQNFLMRWWKKPLAAIVVTSIIFSLTHLSVYLFLTRAVLGFCLGYLFFTTRNIWISIFAHFINNAIAVYQLYLISSKNEEIKLDKLDPYIPWWTGVISLIFLVGLFWWLDKISKNNRSRIIARELALTATEYDPQKPFIT